MIRLTLVCALLLAAPPAATAGDSRAGTPKAAAAAPGAIVIETGEIGGAKFTVAVPVRWNRRVLLLAHGLRPASAPLVADLSPVHLAYKTLLDEGWIVAKSSYRRNGPILKDAIADLDALRDHIAAKYGNPERVLIEGDSMGGMIATMMSEREPLRDPTGKPAYSGAVAIGASLGSRDTDNTGGVSLQPRMPLIFLTNQSELGGPESYVKAVVPRDDTMFHSTIFTIARNGHVNVNQQERLAALRALNVWIDSGKSSLATAPPRPPYYDATVAPAPGPSTVRMHADNRGFEARSTEVSSVFGNVLVDAQASDFAAAGIAPFSYFQLKVGDKTYRTRYGRDFDSVNRGEWVAFVNGDGVTWIGRNNDNAAATADISAGGTVTVQRYAE